MSAPADSADSAGTAGQPAFTIEQIATYFDMHRRFTEHVEDLADEWFKRWKASEPTGYGGPARWFCGGGVEEIDEDEVTYRYYLDANAAYDRSAEHIMIPMKDLLPEWGQARATLRALGGS